MEGGRSALCASKMLLASISTFVFSMAILLSPQIVIPLLNVISTSAQEIPNFNVAAAGDWGCNSNASVTVNQIVSKSPELVLGLGDYSYRQTADCWLKQVDPIKSKMKITIGNHDDESSALLNQYMNSFGLAKQYYSFNYQNIHFLVLSTELSYVKGSQQYIFAENDLAEASANPEIKWIVVYYHKLAYTSAASHSAIPDLRDSMHPLFEKYKVDIVLQGHYHGYERTFPIKYNAAIPSSPIVTVREASNYRDPEGQIFLTVGTAGASLHTLGEKESYSVMQYRGFGFLNFNFTNAGATLEATFYANDGSIKDQFTFTKDTANTFPNGSSLVGAFYYPWTGGKDTPTPNQYAHWKDEGHKPPYSWASNYLPDINPAIFDPSNELYDSNDPTVVKKQLAWMDKAGVDFVISSWWGQNHYTDKALSNIFTNVLPASDNPNPNTKFVIYYEKEGFADIPVDEIISDINYIKTKYGNSEYYLKIDGKPVVFVYNTLGGAIDETPFAEAQKWDTARKQTGIFVVLKVFTDYKLNSNLADGWHQYAPTKSFEAQADWSAFVSPGFWKYDEAPRLAREDFTTFKQSVQKLAAADVRFKLIETWNEWGEGTGVEPAQKIIHDDMNGFSAAEPSYGDRYINILREYLRN